MVCRFIDIGLGKESTTRARPEWHFLATFWRQKVTHISGQEKQNANSNQTMLRNAPPEYQVRYRQLYYSTLYLYLYLYTMLPYFRFQTYRSGSRTDRLETAIPDQSTLKTEMKLHHDHELIHLIILDSNNQCIQILIFLPDWTILQAFLELIRS